MFAVLGGLEGARAVVCGDDADECAGGGDEEGFHGEGEVLDGRDALGGRKQGSRAAHKAEESADCASTQNGSGERISSLVSVVPVRA